MLYGHDVIISNPPYVFGDGTHETTRFLLYFLNRYAKGRSVIDAGCGTGILSIFAIKCRAESVTAIDVDNDAVECTRANAEANNASINIIKADINIAELSDADIVVANFARWDALGNFPNIAKLTRRLLITTWYKEMPKDELTNGFEIIDCIEGIDYDCYVLKKR